jgi:hypothetical protein
MERTKFMGNELSRKTVIIDYHIQYPGCVEKPSVFLRVVKLVYNIADIHNIKELADFYLPATQRQAARSAWLLPGNICPVNHRTE